MTMMNLTQQNVCSVHDMPNDRQKKQKRRDESAEHIWSILTQILTTFEQLFAFTFEFFGYVNSVV